MSEVFYAESMVFLPIWRSHIGPLCMAATSCIWHVAITIAPPMTHCSPPPTPPAAECSDSPYGLVRMTFRVHLLIDSHQPYHKDETIIRYRGGRVPAIWPLPRSFPQTPCFNPELHKVLNQTIWSVFLTLGPFCTISNRISRQNYWEQSRPVSSCSRLRS